MSLPLLASCWGYRRSGMENLSRWVVLGTVGCSMILSSRGVAATHFGEVTPASPQTGGIEATHEMEFGDTETSRARSIGGSERRMLRRWPAKLFSIATSANAQRKRI